eukprot:9103316-Prorocentrum_lima.AAC.1
MRNALYGPFLGEFLFRTRFLKGDTWRRCALWQVMRAVRLENRPPPFAEALAVPQDIKASFAELQQKYRLPRLKRRGGRFGPRQRQPAPITPQIPALPDEEDLERALSEVMGEVEEVP